MTASIPMGAPLKLAGSGHTRWRDAIGNAIPPSKAEAVGEQLLLALFVAKLGAFALSANLIWVAPHEDTSNSEDLDALHADNH